MVEAQASFADNTSQTCTPASPHVLAATTSTRTIFDWRTLLRLGALSTMAAPKALVIGSGAVGLRTALELLKRDVSVKILSPYPPLDQRTCSQGAGGLWMPVACDDPRTDQFGLETLQELWSQGLDPKSELVEILPAVVLKREHSGPNVDEFVTHQYEAAPGGRTETNRMPGWSKDPRLKFQHLTVEMLSWQNITYQLRLPPEQELKEAGYLYAWMFYTPVVNTIKMLEHYLLELATQGADINVETGEEYESLDHMCDIARAEGVDALFNCTGLAARKICADESDLVPGRGVVFHYDREKVVRRPAVRENTYGDNKHDAVIMTSEAPWASENAPCYLIPRGDKLVVGGTLLKGDTEPCIRESERLQLYKNAERMGIDVDQSERVGEWTGFRPYRRTLRCELDRGHSSDALKVIHNFGHGGSGWTINAGTARFCVDLWLKA